MRAAALPRSDSVHENKLPRIARLYFHLIFKMTAARARARASSLLGDKLPICIMPLFINDRDTGTRRANVNSHLRRSAVRNLPIRYPIATLDHRSPITRAARNLRQSADLKSAARRAIIVRVRRGNRPFAVAEFYPPLPRHRSVKRRKRKALQTRSRSKTRASRPARKRERVRAVKNPQE